MSQFGNKGYSVMMAVRSSSFALIILRNHRTSESRLTVVVKTPCYGRISIANGRLVLLWIYFPNNNNL
ncbi:MAG: hypothetical protein JXB20_01275 [Bacilli bacterium]|nr:hypothetical protein [Bacilli bacterium]MBN2696619.1 hypothetical protein [Bacilli bacterium]